MVQPLTRRSVSSSAVALAALLWLVQLQGMLHGLTHLNAAGGSFDPAAPHTVLCADCTAFAQAGAAPLRVAAAPLPAAPGGMRAATPSLAPPDLTGVAAYRSRAPPGL
jgi:hypothetical protein